MTTNESPQSPTSAAGEVSWLRGDYRETLGLLVSGGVAGCVAKTLTAPLSRSIFLKSYDVESIRSSYACTVIRLTILFQVHSMVTTKAQKVIPLLVQHISCH